MLEVELADQRLIEAIELSWKEFFELFGFSAVFSGMEV